MSTAATAVSAPGKVLLAGGYLVLDRRYTGLVFGLNARIRVLVRTVEKDDASHAHKDSPCIITVCSPQFKNATWVYECHFSGDNGRIRVVKTAQ